MNLRLAELAKELERLEDRITTELRVNAEQLNYKLERGKAVFTEDVRQSHRRLSRNSLIWLVESEFLFILTAPIIYSVLIPALFLDIFVSVYQAVNFRVYGIGQVRRCDYVIFDRHSLKYLNAIERINCIYCEYFNGVMAYAGEVAGRTEQFWCPIRHARHDAPRHSWTHNFVDYGDGLEYRKRLNRLRLDLRRLTEDAGEQKHPESERTDS